jgi:plastocyanin
MRRSAAGLVVGVVLLVLAAPASPHAGHGAIEIDIGGFAFTPQNVSLYQGDSVVFTWKGPDTNHSATGDTFDTDAGKGSAEVLHTIGDTYAVTFNDPGTFTYHCKVHSSMTGTIKVQPSPVAPPSATAPVLTKVRVSPRKFARRTTLTFNLDWPASMRATLRKGSRVVKEVDFNAVPGDNKKRVDFGKRVKPGKYALKLVAVDRTNGKASKAASVPVEVQRSASAASVRAPAYPPITCGRVTISGTRYVVRSHGPSCTTAIRGVKGFIVHRTSPRFYRCKRYGGDVPAYCTGAIAKYKNRYFFANKS